MNPDTLTAQALLNCLVREVSAPEEQAWEADGHLLVRLARSDRLLRLGTRRPSAGLGPGDRLGAGDGGWPRRGAAKRGRVAAGRLGELAALIADELTLATGVANDEFAAQVGNSHAAMTAIIAARQATAGRGRSARRAGQAAGRRPCADPVLDRYLASEQALVAGHRFHPAPKARAGDPREWLPYAPEAGARFPLRFLAVRGDALDADGDTAGLDRLGSPAAPAGYHVLPAHPWQLRLLAGRPWLRRALRDRLLIDLGAGHARRSCPPRRSAPSTTRWPTCSASSASTCGSPTASARTPGTSSAGAVALTRLLGPVPRTWRRAFPVPPCSASPATARWRWPTRKRPRACPSSSGRACAGTSRPASPRCWPRP